MDWVWSRRRYTGSVKFKKIEIFWCWIIFNISVITGQLGVVTPLWSHFLQHPSSGQKSDRFAPSANYRRQTKPWQSSDWHEAAEGSGGPRDWPHVSPGGEEDKQVGERDSPQLHSLHRQHLPPELPHAVQAQQWEGVRGDLQEELQDRVQQAAHQPDCGALLHSLTHLSSHGGRERDMQGGPPEFLSDKVQYSTQTVGNQMLTVSTPG